MAEHTPGPWFLDDGGDVLTRDYVVIVYRTSAVAGGDPDERRRNANMRLIAAAPDLLDSVDPVELEAMASIIWSTHPDLCHTLRARADRQRAAIAKAEGRDAS